MALFEVIVEGVYFGQQCINRWNYVAPDTVLSIDSSEALAVAFGVVPDAGVYPADTLFQAWRSLVANTFQYESYFIRDVYDGSDFINNAFIPGTVGVGSGESMPPFAAFGARTNRINLDIRRGFKRFVGVNEGSSAAGGTLTSGAVTALDALCVKMSEVLNYSVSGDTIAFAPCIVQKEKHVLTGGRVSYRYFETIEEQLPHITVGNTWEGYDTVRTQNSRQYGRGS